MSPPELRRLRERLAEITDLSALGALMFWDQNTMMPPGGAAARADMADTLQRTVHARETDPELGRIGLSEREARAKGYRLKIGSVPMAYVARAIERGETSGLMKIVINADNDRILGATILGPDGGELVQILMGLMLADAPWTLFKDAMFIHPTLAEGFFALMANVEAA